jgi:hypothetical protein
MITSWQIAEALAHEHVRDLTRAADHSRLRGKERKSFERRTDHAMFLSRPFSHLAAAFRRRVKTRASWCSNVRVSRSAVAPDG